MEIRSTASIMSNTADGLIVSSEWLISSFVSIGRCWNSNLPVADKAVVSLLDMCLTKVRLIPNAGNAVCPQYFFAKNGARVPGKNLPELKSRRVDMASRDLISTRNFHDGDVG